ncbi:MAG: MaoC family dehydratase N-terminal domain-containing protein [Chloroflexota bacterium]|nr:MaoC family dehydratase N-terminal domain-containing protein [Chloroflexota bacterium]
MAESIVTEQMRSWLNKELSRIVFDVEKVLLRRYAEAIDDPNPKWQETASPSLFMTLFAEGGSVQYPFKSSLSRLLDGGGEWEFFREAQLGDTLTGVRRIIEYKEKEGKLGHMLLITRETSWANQRDELVARSRCTSILY